MTSGTGNRFVAAARATFAGVTRPEAAEMHGVCLSSVSTWRMVLIWAPDLVPLITGWPGMTGWPVISEARRRKDGLVPICADCFARRWREYDRRARRGGLGRGCLHNNPARLSPANWRAQAPAGPWTRWIPSLPATSGQLAMRAVAEGQLARESSAASLARRLGIRASRVTEARAVLDSAPDLVAAVIAGSVPLKTAYRVALRGAGVSDAG